MRQIEALATQYDHLPVATPEDVSSHVKSGFEYILDRVKPHIRLLSNSKNGLTRLYTISGDIRQGILWTPKLPAHNQEPVARFDLDLTNIAEEMVASYADTGWDNENATHWVSQGLRLRKSLHETRYLGLAVVHEKTYQLQYPNMAVNEDWFAEDVDQLPRFHHPLSDLIRH